MGGRYNKDIVWATIEHREELCTVAVDDQRIKIEVSPTGVWADSGIMQSFPTSYTLRHSLPVQLNSILLCVRFNKSLFHTEAHLAIVLIYCLSPYLYTGSSVCPALF